MGSGWQGDGMGDRREDWVGMGGVAGGWDADGMGEQEDGREMGWG